MSESISIKMFLCSKLFTLFDQDCKQVCGMISCEQNQDFLGQINILPSIFNAESEPGEKISHFANFLKRLEVPSKNCKPVLASKSKKLSEFPKNLPKPRLNNNTELARFSTQGEENDKINVKALIKTLVDPQRSEKLLQCSFCSYQTTYFSTIKRHVEQKHLPKTETFNCLTCGKEFGVKSNLKIHYVKVHKMPELAAKTMLQC